ncbi:MAG: sugar kinase [Anaerolineae bacterium]|nr:sugar kinase [Anaerolineae bacterium]
MPDTLKYDITKDNLTHFVSSGPAFVTFGETMVRDTPADNERPERTRQVHLSMAGSEYTLAIGLARLGIPASYITRVPDNPYGRMLRNIARENGINTDHIVWAPKYEPMGRFIYEIGRTPRKNTGTYQRMYSAASRLDAGMVNWESALKDCTLFHTSGISFGLATHSGYERNYLLAAFEEAIAHKPVECWVGLDFNYRATLWSVEQARAVMTPILTDHVDVLITSIEDMAKLYGMGCGQYSAEQIDRGDIGRLEDNDIRAFAAEACARFNTKIVAITIRYPDTFEQHRWESAAASADGFFFRSPTVKPITLWDRLGGGDTWNAGFYYGLLTEAFSADGIEKGVLVGDAATRIKQTLMFDLPVIDKDEVQALLKADVLGGGKRTAR